MKKLLTGLLVAGSLLFMPTTHAEVKTYEGVGEYYMSDYETPDIAQQRAKRRAEQNACEQAGVYVKSFSRAKNFELVEDIIETMTSGILKVIDVQYHRENFDNNTTRILVMIKVNIDSDDILKWLSKDSQEKSELVAQMEALRKANAEQEKQIAELKRRLAHSTTKEDEELIAQKFADEDKIFLANQKVEEGWKLWDKKDFNEASKLFGEAIELNPDNAEAWRGRGTALNDLKQYEQAVKYHDKAVELNPNYDRVYNNRGWNYCCLKQYERAIPDLDKAIELNPNNAKAYNNRGIAYMDGLKQYERAVQDFTKAIELNPKYYYAYNNRGISYRYLKEYNKAVDNFSKAIELNPNYAKAYNNRSWAYLGLKQYKRAIQDADKAIELNPNYDTPYNNRGWAFYCLKKYPQALKDFDKALELNPNYTRAKNNRERCLKAMGK